MIVLETMLSEAFLYEGLLAGTTQKVQLDGVEVLLAF